VSCVLALSSLWLSTLGCLPRVDAMKPSSGIKTPVYKFGVFNARHGFHDDGKQVEILQAAKDRGLCLLVVPECGVTTPGYSTTDAFLGWTVHSLRTTTADNGRDKTGVAIALAPSIAGSARRWVPPKGEHTASERVLVLELAGQRNVTLIGVYAPSISARYPARGAEQVSFWTDLEAAIKAVPKHSMLVLCGDFNASVGSAASKSADDSYGGALGRHGIERPPNPQGKRLLNLAKKHNMSIANTFFQQQSIAHKATWNSIANELFMIDYFMVKRRDLHHVKNARVYRSFNGTGIVGEVTSAQVLSDHELLEMTMTVRIWFKKAIERNHTLLVLLLDLKTAFDSVDREALWAVLHSYGFDANFINTLRQLYTDTHAVVHFNGYKSRPVKIERGVQQGGPEAPDLFNLFINIIIAEALDKMGDSTGVKLTVLANGQLFRPQKIVEAIRAGASVESLRPLLIADDITLLAELHADAPENTLQKMLDAVADACRRWKLDFNLTKNKLLAINPKAGVPVPTLTLGGAIVARVEKVRYLGAIFDESGTLDAEIGARIRAATNAGRRLKTSIFKRCNVSLRTKLSYYKSLVESALFYGCTSWTTTKEHIDQLEVGRMKYLRVIAKPLPGWRFDATRPWLKPSNARVLAHCKMEPVKVVLRRRRLIFLGKILRMDPTRIGHRVLYGQMDGTRRGGGRTTLRKVLHEDFRALMPHAGAGWSTDRAADEQSWRALVNGASAERLNE